MTDDGGTTVEVKGLRQAVENLTLLAGPLRDKIGHQAQLDASLVISRAMAAATYTTFNRQTGFIRSGFGVRVARGLKGELLTSVVVQYPQRISGSNPMVRAYRKRHLSISPRTRKVELDHVAYWWRFLEFGTGPRFSAKKPRFLKRGLAPRSERDWKSLRSYAAAGGHGAIRARPWVRPAFSGSAERSIDTYRDTFVQQVESEVNNLPK